MAGTAAVALVFTACGGDDSASAESWCDFVEEADVVEEVFDGLDGTSTDLEAELATVSAIIERLPDEAPSEISDDAKVLADGTMQLVDALADADYDLFSADLSFMAEDGLEEAMDTAGDNIDAYTETECGRPFGDGASDTDTGDVDADTDTDAETDTSEDFDVANGSLRDQLVTQFESIGLTNSEAQCIADNLDFTDPAVQSGDIAAMLDVFESCDIGLDRLAELGG